MNNLKLTFLSFMAFLLFCCSENETLIDKSNLETDTRQQVLNDFTPLPCSEAMNLTICIKDCWALDEENPDHMNWGIVDAIQAYNDADLGLELELLTNCDEGADIQVECVEIDLYPVMVATSRPNENGAPAPFILIDFYNVINCGSYEDRRSRVKSFMMREIGRALGVHYNNGNNTPEDADLLHITGTPEFGVSDPGSVFNFPTDCNNFPVEFNENDLAALEYLYQLPEDPCDCPTAYPACSCVEISDPCDCPDLFDPCACYELGDCNCPGLEEPNFDITYEGNICFMDIVTFNILPLPSGQNLTVTAWDVVSGGLNIMSNSGNYAIVEAHDPGPSTICATAVNSCGTEQTYCINVEVQTEADCNGDGEIYNPK